MLDHGGRLQRAAQQYGIPLADWLDLSTGINPQSWPVPSIPSSIWSRLPEDEDGLAQAACDYYGCAQALPVAGSQAAIQALPHLRPRGRVGVISPGYAEHGHAWHQAGYEVVRIGHSRVGGNPEGASGCIQIGELDSRLRGNDGKAIEVLILIQPNNPTGTHFLKEQLLAWHAELAARGGWLVVDEAFIDATPEHSLAPFCDRPGLIVLRSLGKFFGLAGARVGFALAQPDLLQGLAERLGPWSVSGPARHVAALALRDTAWQQAARAQLQSAGQRLADLLRRHGLAPEGGCALFQWLRLESAAELHKQLARRGILTRLFDEPASLRLGLPGSEAAWARLDSALVELRP